MRVLLFLLLYILSSATSGAQPTASRDDYERILVPIAPTGPTHLRPGAHGSRWQSILTVRNAGDQPVEVFHPFEIFHCLIVILCEPRKAMPPHSTAITTDRQDWGSSIFATIGAAERGPGALMHVRRGRTDEVFFDLLVEPGLRTNFPRYAEAVLEPPRFAFESGQPVRLRITPLGEAFAYWAFVSLTNNETQLISVVTPE